MLLPSKPPVREDFAGDLEVRRQVQPELGGASKFRWFRRIAARRGTCFSEPDQVSPHGLRVQLIGRPSVATGLPADSDRSPSNYCCTRTADRRINQDAPAVRSTTRAISAGVRGNEDAMSAVLSLPAVPEPNVKLEPVIGRSLVTS